MYSVIIPSLGRINFLNELLESIYNQSVKPNEIIILLDNNKSCKNGAKFITALAITKNNKATVTLTRTSKRSLGHR